MRSVEKGGIIRHAWLTQEPLWIADVIHDPTFQRAPLAAKAGLHSAFAFPILVEEKSVGVIEFYNREIREPDALLLQSLGSIGSQIGQFCQRKQAEQQIQYLAYYDGLTGLPNRTLFGQRLNHAL